MTVNNKSTVLTFAGPTHHLNILSPIMDALKRLGAHAEWFTSNAEAAFEHGLTQRFGWESDAWDMSSRYVDQAEREACYDHYREAVQPHYFNPTPLGMMLPPVTDRILWDIATDASGISRMLKEKRPTASLMLHEINRWGKILAFWSKETGIPAYSIQEGMYYGDTRAYTGHNEYSTSLVWGEKTKEKLVAAGNNPASIEVFGHPNLLNRWTHANTDEEKAKAWASLPPHFQNKQIVTVYVTGITISENLSITPMMEGLKASPYRLVFQSAILGNLTENEKLKKLLLPFKEEAYYCPDQSLLWQQAAISDVVCVWGCSTFGLEMAWAGKPLAEVWAPGQPLDFEKEGISVPGMMTEDPATGKIRSAVLWIERALEQNAREEYQAKRKEWVDGYIYNADAADALATRILSV